MFFINPKISLTFILYFSSSTHVHHSSSRKSQPINKSATNFHYIQTHTHVSTPFLLTVVLHHHQTLCCLHTKSKIDPSSSFPLLLQLMYNSIKHRSCSKPNPPPPRPHPIKHPNPICEWLLNEWRRKEDEEKCVFDCWMMNPNFWRLKIKEIRDQFFRN